MNQSTIERINQNQQQPVQTNQSTIERDNQNPQQPVETNQSTIERDNQNPQQPVERIFKNFFQVERLIIEVAILILLVLALMKIIAPEIRAVTSGLFGTAEVHQTTPNQPVSPQEVLPCR